MMVKTIVMDEGTKQQQQKLTPDRLMNFILDSKQQVAMWIYYCSQQNRTIENQTIIIESKQKITQENCPFQPNNNNKIEKGHTLM